MLTARVNDVLEVRSAPRVSRPLPKLAEENSLAQHPAKGATDACGANPVDRASIANEEHSAAIDVLDSLLFARRADLHLQ